MLEVFTKEGIDSQKAKDFIFQKTGMMPAICDSGTHYVTNQKTNTRGAQRKPD
jgi:hypothetical protein